MLNLQPANLNLLQWGGDDGRLTKAGMHKLRNYIHTKMQDFFSN